MAQKALFAAVSLDAELLHHDGLFGLWHAGAIKVRPFSIGISLERLEFPLIGQPLVGEQLTTVHATDRNNHLDVGR